MNLNFYLVGFFIEVVKFILENFYLYVDKFKIKFERIIVENFFFFVNYVVFIDGLF